MTENHSTRRRPGIPEPIARALNVARRHLDMDVAYLAVFDDGRQRFLALDGDADTVALDPDAEPLLSDTICARMANDESLRVIPDVSAEGRVRDVRTAAGIGAYVGVPVLLRDGTLLGSFCCVSRDPDHRLSDRDVLVLHALAEIVMDDVEAIRARMNAGAAIRGVLAGSAITTALQPIVSLTDGRCIGAEALSRFPSPLGAPDAVFAAAHDAGLGVDLERLAVKTAIEMLPALAPTQFLAVNVAPDVAVHLAELAKGAEGIALDRLVLEITEHAAVASYQQLRAALRPLRDRGLRLAIDDAGAGFASLHHIVELRPDIIKIDRSLIDGLAGDTARRTVVSSFVLLGLELDALVIAEGLEAEADLADVRRLGVAAAQGYLFARPSTEPTDHARWAGRPYGEALRPSR